MCTPSVILSALKNEDTGIDISVPRYKEEEAPLGGISILYEITVLTKLDLFKTRLHKSGDVVHFTVSINSHRLPSFSIPKSDSTESPELNIDNLTQETKQSKEPLDETDELFPKMKNVTTIREQPILEVKKVDLFEEEKFTKENKFVSTTIKGGLFDDFEDEELFSSKPIEKVIIKAPEEKPKETPAISKKPAAPKKKKEAFTNEVDDSEIILQNRKIGEVSLFEEQDLGGFITKDEESLFLVTSPSSKNKKNVLLFSEDEIISPDSDQSLNENLDDLLNLEPLPNTSALSKKSEEDATDNGILEIPMPQPRLRKTSIDQTDFTIPAQKPEVMPRKIFLNKPSVPTKPKPSVPPRVAAKPTSLQSKPPPPPKPKIPAKKPQPTAPAENSTKDLDTINANMTENTMDPVVSNLANDLKELDILKYIEQEEKSLDAELNLFD